MIKIIFLEGKHFVIILFTMIPSFHILLTIANVFNIFIDNITMCSFLLDNLINLISIIINL